LALLERALRIDPDSAEVYLEMAKTHHAGGDRAQARATAERGLLYCSGSTQCDALRAYTR
jgi:Tfp pilus assembly protein PilF